MGKTIALETFGGSSAPAVVSNKGMIGADASSCG